ncbi:MULTISPECIES: hypothetical protein [unclassified Legionella]|uniref:hypothetical protein n=1 Tax=unclassified Legionella TaxID=2622702 RepID=UPI001055013C|nr:MULTISPECIES: hypothetical protein [unclassified Legionella]MDI9819339.1 hypothetical protein [Legionella sp. PL877]
MEQFRINQRLGLIAKRILALPKKAKQACLSEIKKNYSQEKLSLLHKNIKQQERLLEKMRHPNKIPLSDCQLLFWSIELTSGYSKNEVISFFWEGKLDKIKLENVLNYLVTEFDIFNFRVNNWLPYAKKLPKQKIELVTFPLEQTKSYEEQIDAINMQLAQVDLRKLKQNIYPCLIQIDERNALLQLVITHKAIDAKTKSLIWQILWQKYNDLEIKNYYPYRNYIHSEKSYYANLYQSLQRHIEKDYGNFSPCQISNDIIDQQTSIKKRLLYTLEKHQTDALKEFAYSHDYTIEELIISATLNAFKPYCKNNNFLIQLISQPHFNNQYQEILGPCLNERSFAFNPVNDDLIGMTEDLKNKNRKSLNYSNLPYGAALGWLYYCKYKKSAPLISFMLRAFTGISKYTRVSKAMADCYAGLIAYEFFANKNKAFPLLSFNFRNAVSDKKIKKGFVSNQLKLKHYFYPLYHNTKNYVSINIDDTNDGGLILHIESYYLEVIDKQIMQTILNNLNNYSAFK